MYFFFWWKKNSDFFLIKYIRKNIMFNQYVFHSTKSSTLPIKVFKKSINLDNISETVLNIRENVQRDFMMAYC